MPVRNSAIASVDANCPGPWCMSLLSGVASRARRTHRGCYPTWLSVTKTQDAGSRSRTMSTEGARRHLCDALRARHPYGLELHPRPWRTHESSKGPRNYEPVFGGERLVGSPRVAAIGLGKMGGPMALHLHEKGLLAAIYSPRTAKEFAAKNRFPASLKVA